jgi:hypothetical protein
VRERAARLLVGNDFREWARAPTCGNRSACGVGDSSVRLEARLGAKHATALCVSTTGGVRVPQFWIVVAHGTEPPPISRDLHLI